MSRERSLAELEPTRPLGETWRPTRHTPFHSVERDVDLKVSRKKNEVHQKFFIRHLSYQVLYPRLDRKTTNVSR